MKDGIILSKEHGVQPCIPLCPVCGKEKNEIALLGAAGDELAKALGHADGAMPMHAHIPGDYVPCDTCKERGIAIYIAEETKDGSPGEIKQTMLVKEDLVKRMLKEGEMRDKILKDRVMAMPVDIAERFGLLGVEVAQ